MKVLYSFAALAAVLAPSIGTASAQTPAAAAATRADIAVGAVVYDPQGGEVGKIDSISGDNVVIDTGTHKATLPKTSFGKGKNGPAISATKAEIDAAVAASMAQANAARDAALIVGTEVRGTAGVPVGTIKEVTASQVVLNRPSGMVSLNKALFAFQNGAVVLRLTAAELDAAAQAAAAPGGTPETATAAQGAEAASPEQAATTPEAEAPAHSAAPEHAAEHHTETAQ